MVKMTAPPEINEKINAVMAGVEAKLAELGAEEGFERKASAMAAAFISNTLVSGNSDHESIVAAGFCLMWQNVLLAHGVPEERAEKITLELPALAKQIATALSDIEQELIERLAEKHMPLRSPHGEN